MKQKTYSFKDESGISHKYVVKEQLRVLNNDYVLMSPTENLNDIEVYQYNFTNGNECLNLIEDTLTLDTIKKFSKVI